MIFEMLKFLLVDHQKATNNVIDGIQVARDLFSGGNDDDYNDEKLMMLATSGRSRRAKFLLDERQRVRPLIISEILACSSAAVDVTESTPVSKVAMDMSRLKKWLKANGIHYDLLGLHRTWKWWSTVAEYAECITGYHAVEAYRRLCP